MFRPNLQNEEHRRAWEILQAVPEGQKSAFLVKAILNSARQDALESTLRRILREELQAVPSQPVQQPEETIPPESYYQDQQPFSQSRLDKRHNQ